MKLKYKLPLFFIPLICLPLLVVAALSYVELRQLAETQARQQLNTLLNQYSRQVRDAINSAETHASYISNDALLHRYLLTEDENDRYSLIQRPLYDRLLRMQSVSPEHGRIAILLADGSIDLEVVSETDGLRQVSINSPLPDWRSLQKAVDKPAFYRDSTSGKVSLFTVRNIYLRDPFKVKDVTGAAENFSGALVLITDIFSQVTPLDDGLWQNRGALLFTDSQGQILNSIINNSLTEPDESWLTPNKEGADSQPVQLSSGHYRLYQKQIHNQLWLQALVPEESMVLSGQIVAGNVISVSVIASLLAIPLLLFLLNSQILTPVRQLTSAFVRLGKQEEEIQVVVAQDDELGELSQLFNRTSIELHRSHQQIRSLAFSDSLTGLPNRFMFMKNLKQAMDRANKHNQRMALLFLDLDRFKQINDSMGHNTGDALLQQVALILQRNLRQHDLVTRSNDELAALKESNLARLGGDEFTILLQNISSPEEARLIAERIITALSEPIEVNDQQLNTGASIGISLFPQHGSNSEELIRHADIAMYQAKRADDTNYRFFSEQNIDSEEEKQIEKRLYRAVKAGELTVSYQPILDQRSLKTVAIEALLRWEDKQLGPIEPGIFVPIAERCGLISLVSDHVMSIALSQLKAWHDSGMDNLKLSLNIATAQLQDRHFIDKICAALQHHQLPVDSIWLEVKEAQLLSENSQVRDNTKALRDAGFIMALDDYGTGFSSVSALKDKPASILKVDHSLVCELETNDKQQSLVAAILLMAKTLNLKVIIEGVENEEQLVLLTELGADMLQGYLFSAPLSAEDLSRLLNNQLWLEQSNNRYSTR